MARREDFVVNPADWLVAGHLAFILFAVFGGLLTLRWRRLAWLHLPALAWAAGITLVGGYCPLTAIENRLREAAGGQGYHGSFIDHYLVPLIYPPGLTRTAQIIGATILIAANAAIYGRLWATRQKAMP